MESGNPKDDREGKVVEGAMKQLENQFNEIAGGLNNKLEDISKFFFWSLKKKKNFGLLVGKMDVLEKKIHSAVQEKP